MPSSLTKELQEQIRDMYSAENQLLKALPRVAKAASTPSLREAIEGHLEETEAHVERLEKIAEMLEIKPTGKTCKAMAGLIDEGKEAIDAEGDEAVHDVALVAAAQRIEHYEIAAYGTARAIADHLGRKDVADLLQLTLDEEGAADKKLTAICEGEIFPAASAASPAPASAPKGKGATARSAGATSGSRAKGAARG